MSHLEYNIREKIENSLRYLCKTFELPKNVICTHTLYKYVYMFVSVCVIVDTYISYESCSRIMYCMLQKLNNKNLYFE